ncbi:MAG: hypothetical protein COV52_06675 [Gammaproteobacteria bacterium CG11_big_fil_rev_8_21_14_0_20_46_22]|nr:MAG: hypothetical protein COV52_06675 [Gammaproteobacteria bacterium CG11_big_fil_rev_8_21_14_0_20_46_22]
MPQSGQKPYGARPSLNNLLLDHAFKLKPHDNQRLSALCGPAEENINFIEKHLGVTINHRGHRFNIQGDDRQAIEQAAHVLEALYAETENGEDIVKESIHLALKEDPATPAEKDITLRTERGLIRARTPTQKAYLERIFDHAINFGIGPAGTGKTFLAVACAVDALQKHLVQRLILVRPAVEAGEKLGFLPGDLSQKVDPYLRPIYDALYELLGFENVGKLIANNVIEIAPLAYMRGRTLNDAFIILDEAQNSTKDQMKMFLTRIGFGSKAVITGDVTQIDLAKNQPSGLTHVMHILPGVNNVSFTRFSAKDVVRHPVVQSIIRAYEKDEHEHRA